MSFYEEIAREYDVLFPLDEEALFFLKKRIVGNQFLDIGSSTGSLILELASHFSFSCGMDTSTDLLALAQKKKEAYLKEEQDFSGEINFLLADMKDLNRLFKNRLFSFITCVGNTLVHLKKMSLLSYFFKDVYKLLEPNGVFIFQIINYDRIAEKLLIQPFTKNVVSLPTIERESLTFERSYSSLKDNGLINFDTHLFIKKDKSSFHNSIPLLPVSKEELSVIALESGFKKQSFYASFNESPYQKEGYLCIGVLQK